MKETLTPGITLYFVIENLADSSLNREPYHYEIVSGEISKVNRYGNGRQNEYVVPTKNRLGRSSALKYVFDKKIGKNAFLTREEAEQAAEKMTNKYEQTWGWALKAPLAMPWRGVEP